MIKPHKNAVFWTKELYLCLVLILLLMTSWQADARRFRSFQPLQSAKASVLDKVVPTDSTYLKAEDIEQAVSKIIKNWNDGRIELSLSQDFFDRSRLVNTWNVTVPRDARLYLQSIGEFQLLRQQTEQIKKGVIRQLSTVSVVVFTQLEYNDASGFVRLPGTSEWIIQISKIAVVGDQD